MFKHIVAMGTFDHFHEGHKHYLRKVAELGEKLTIVILATPPEKAYAELIEPYETRRRNLGEFLQESNINAEISEPVEKPEDAKVALDPSIDTVAFGVGSYDPNLQKRVDAVNETRAKLGLNQACIILIPVLRDAEGKIYSSRRIRESTCPISARRRNVENPADLGMRFYEAKTQKEYRKIKEFIESQPAGSLADRCRESPGMRGLSDPSELKKIYPNLKVFIGEDESGNIRYINLGLVIDYDFQGRMVKAYQVLSSPVRHEDEDNINIHFAFWDWAIKEGNLKRLIPDLRFVQGRIQPANSGLVKEKFGDAVTIYGSPFDTAHGTFCFVQVDVEKVT